jgi:RNA polymerase sigma-70 factor (ECF subfamily)
MSTDAFALISSSLSADEALAPAKSELSSATDVAAEAGITETDEALIRKIGKGDRDALCLIFQRYARPVRSVAYRILRNQQEAEDLVQDVFLHLFKKATLFDSHQGRAGSWIVHIAYQQALNRRRYLNRRHFYNCSDLHDSTVRTAAIQAPSISSATSIRDVLGTALVRLYEQRLSVEQRRVLELYFFSGHSFDEVAEVMETSRANVRNHYYRGLDRLRRYVLPGNIHTQ